MRESMHPILAHSQMGPRNPDGHSIPACPVAKCTLTLMTPGAAECAASELPNASEMIKIEEEFIDMRAASCEAKHALAD
jgi:hypothetical protein